MQHKDQNFSGTAEVLDGNEYVNCKFTNCALTYRGGGLPTISGCSFEDCRWQLEDASERTLVFLRAIYHGRFDARRDSHAPASLIRRQCRPERLTGAMHVPLGSGARRALQ